MATKKVNSVKICELSTGRVVFYNDQDFSLKIGPNGKKHTPGNFIKLLTKSDRRRVRKGLVKHGFRTAMIYTLETKTATFLLTF